MLDMHSDSQYAPLDCPVCLLMLRDANDLARYHSSKCCVDCWIGFLEPLRKLNSDDQYLPNSAELKAYRKKIVDLTNLEKEQC